MNSAINEFAKAIIALLANTIKMNIPGVGALAITLFEEFLKVVGDEIDKLDDLSDEEKAKLKAVLENVALKTTDQYLEEAGTNRADIDNFINSIKNG